MVLESAAIWVEELRWVDAMDFRECRDPMIVAGSIVDAVNLSSCIGIKGNGGRFSDVGSSVTEKSPCNGEGQTRSSTLIHSLGSTIEVIIYRLSFPDSVSESDGSGYSSSEPVATACIRTASSGLATTACTRPVFGWLAGQWRWMCPTCPQL